MKITKEYYSLHPKYCKYCNKQLLFSQHTNIFCSKSCACTYNNLHRDSMSAETKHKISESMKASTKVKVRKQKLKKLRETLCPVCKKIFYYTPQHKRKTCSTECLRKLQSINSKKSVKQRISNGTFQGWKTRNVTSYAEKFFKVVLDNYNINYIREYVVNINKTKRYFLDFYIKYNDRNIDLEIDGKQHLYEDRKEHDIIRDTQLKDFGYEVYRISWNQINNESGKQTMQTKITDFLKFLYK